MQYTIYMSYVWDSLVLCNKASSSFLPVVMQWLGVAPWHRRELVFLALKAACPIVGREGTSVDLDKVMHCMMFFNILLKLYRSVH